MFQPGFWEANCNHNISLFPHFMDKMIHQLYTKIIVGLTDNETMIHLQAMHNFKATCPKHEALSTDQVSYQLGNILYRDQSNKSFMCEISHLSLTVVKPAANALRALGHVLLFLQHVAAHVLVSCTQPTTNTCF